MNWSAFWISLNSGICRISLPHWAEGTAEQWGGLLGWLSSLFLLKKQTNKKEALSSSALWALQCQVLTCATPAAIEAMKNAHREELERELEKSQRSQISSVNADIEALRRQYL